MTKIIVVHPGLYTPANEALTGSIAPDVVAIRYSDEMTKEDVLGAVDGPVSSIAFMYHYPGFDTVPFFYDKPSDISDEIIATKNYDTKAAVYDKVSDISGEKIIRKRTSKYRYFSDTLIDIITSLRDLNVGSGNTFIVDLLTCDLNKQSFKDEILKVEGELGVDIRYSVDKTGNPASGANWVLESDGVNVKTLYFTDGVLAWNGVLLTDITAAIKIGTYNSFITWNAGTSTFTVVDNFSWSTFIGTGDADSYIVVGDGEIFDGNNKAIDLTGYDAWYGLLSSSGSSLETGPVIKNLGILNGATTNRGGFITRKAQKYFTIQGCYSTGNINNLYSGGICSTDNANCTVTNCYNTGNINGEGAGGICGAGPGYYGACTVTNCHNTGNVNGTYAGGICGGWTGEGGTCTIDNCYSTSSITGQGAGGICGGIVGYFGSCTVTNCYNTGIVSGKYAGGICGDSAGTTGIFTVTKCHSTGSITGQEAGGICGSFAGYNKGNCTVTNCYSIGDINNLDCGGICGSNPGMGNGVGNPGNCTITNCYSTGVNGFEAGGICGRSAGILNGTCTVNSSVCNGGTIAGSGSNNITINYSSTSLSDINGNIYYTGWSASIWTPGGTVIVGVSPFNLPILLAFQGEPWIIDSSNPNYYDIATDAALFFVDTSVKYSYTILANGTARITGITNGVPSGNIKIMYISGTISAGILSTVPISGSYQITEIGNSVFANQTGITGFAAPFASLFGDSAFNGCSALVYLYVGIPTSVPSFGTDCFTDCPLTNGIYKNSNNSDWSTVPVSTLKSYTPLITTMTSTMVSGTQVSVTPFVVSGGSITGGAPNPLLMTVYNYYVNGAQTVTNSPAPAPSQSIDPTDTYFITVGNDFETNVAVSTGQTQGISLYSYGQRIKFMFIGT